MHPIVTAVIAAVTSLAEPAVKDAYSAVKALLAKRFGADAKVVAAVKEVEADPKSPGRQTVLAEELTKSKADADEEIVAAVNTLVEAVKRLASAPAGLERVHVAQNVTGNENVFSGTGDASKITTITNR